MTDRERRYQRGFFLTRLVRELLENVLLQAPDHHSTEEEGVELLCGGEGGNDINKTSVGHVYAYQSHKTHAKCNGSS
jgi:hypothetical protein